MPRDDARDAPRTLQRKTPRRCAWEFACGSARPLHVDTARGCALWTQNAQRATDHGGARPPTPGHCPLKRKRMDVVDIPRPNPRKAAEFQSVPILLRIAQGLIHFRPRKPERIALWQRPAAARSRKSPDRRNDPTRRAESGTLCPLERLLHLILLVEIAPMRSGTPVRTFALRQQLTRV